MEYEVTARASEISQHFAVILEMFWSYYVRCFVFRQHSWDVLKEIEAKKNYPWPRIEPGSFSSTAEHFIHQATATEIVKMWKIIYLT